MASLEHPDYTRKIMDNHRTDSLLTNDGVRIHYVDVGQGEPVVLLPGFSQTAAQFAKQITELSRDYRVIAVDHRGHGRSGKPDHGYRVSRLAGDLRDLIHTLDLREVTLLGHSLGCTVIWCYLDLFGGDRVGRLVLVDQAAVTSADLVPQEQAVELGGIFTAELAFGIAAGMRGANPDATAKMIVGMMHTPTLSGEDADWITEQNLLLPRKHAVTLHLDHYGNDWRDVLPRITVPTLVIGGASSFFDARVPRWVAAQIPGAQVRVFSEAERGSHLMFWENPELFNTVVREFLTTGRVTS
ncbi:alpha/beta fold hydrolase [Micromonospora sp. NPDC050397]|uniref:alpha/beta fold hydrolase n=1 Tax=Micromonospora sp. NPDC050397 TaxID=3364279 RepID=UPI00384FF805